MSNSNSGNKPTLKISFNSPVILWFCIICVAALVLNTITGGTTNKLFFSVYRSSMKNPLTYLRFILHVFGHANVSHLVNNMMMLLIVGPLLEEKYGQKNMIIIMAVTALVTGIAEVLFFPNVMLLGASGIVFAMILLSSFTSFKEGTIPVTFILVAVLYIGDQVISGVTKVDNVSNFTHIIGGAVGAVTGFMLNGKKTA
ncbi:MAG: rhomboid family intramembrane serine protease [Lachnospiraceae bacterium]|nr:rhomboid family intramembrane serine protease [Lachnospiraceae bacterium]